MENHICWQSVADWGYMTHGIPANEVNEQGVQGAITLPGGPVGYRELFRFYLPLAIQAASQALTYPLVAAIASHGEGGPLNLAGMAQAMAAMGLLGMLGAGLLTTGMVFGKTRAGFARFLQVNWLFTGIVVLLMGVLCIPPFAHFWFGVVLGLPASIERPAYLALIASLSLQTMFFIRNPYQACLYLHGATHLASIATITRIVGTVLLIPVFLFFGLVGPVWAVMAQALAVASEVFLSWFFARPYIRQLPPGRGVPPTHKEMIAFTLPLSAGGFFLNISGVVITWAITRMPDPERMMQAYFLAGGLAGPAAFAASRVQTVVLTMLPRPGATSLLWRFTLLVGLLMSLAPLLVILPGLQDVYYVGLQRTPAELMPLVRISAVSLVLHPLMLALRGYLEGHAAFQKQPMAIMVSNILYFIALTGAALVCIALGVAGNLLPAVAFLAANIAAVITIRILIAHRKERHPANISEEQAE